jgi:hypothetical protein
MIWQDGPTYTDDSHTRTIKEQIEFYSVVQPTGVTAYVCGKLRYLGRIQLFNVKLMAIYGTMVRVHDNQVLNSQLLAPVLQTKEAWFQVPGNTIEEAFANFDAAQDAYAKAVHEADQKAQQAARSQILRPT